MLDIYSPLRGADVPFVITDVESAELIKYASNGFLATKISFINEVAELCEALGADVEVVAKGMGLDSRIGPKFLHPGPGFGGSCFPKDTRAVAQHRPRAGAALPHHRGGARGQRGTPSGACSTRSSGARRRSRGKTVAVLGLSFKPDTDDIRESPALPIVQGLLERGAAVRAFDPEAMDACRPLLPGGDLLRRRLRGGRGRRRRWSSLTEWNQFRKLELDRLQRALRQPLIVDLRNLYEPEKMAEAGLPLRLGRPRAEGRAAKPARAAEPCAERAARERATTGRSSPAAPASSARTSASACSPRGTAWSASTT